MKTKLSLSLFALLALTGCLDDDTPEDKVETITVAISAITYIDSPVTTNYPIEGMRAKIESDADYQFMTFNEIEGFTFEPGYAYELQVEADIPTNSWMNARNSPSNARGRQSACMSLPKRGTSIGELLKPTKRLA